MYKMRCSTTAHTHFFVWLADDHLFMWLSLIHTHEHAQCTNWGNWCNLYLKPSNRRTQARDRNGGARARWPAQKNYRTHQPPQVTIDLVRQSARLNYFIIKRICLAACIASFARRELNQPAKLNLRDGRDWCEFVCGGYKTNKLRARAQVFYAFVCGSAMYGISVRSFVRQVI